MTDLKPCPFCGGTVRFIHTREPKFRNGNKGTGVVHCGPCSIELFGFSADEAQQTWNNRQADVRIEAIETWVAEGKKIFDSQPPPVMFHLGAFWASRPWKKK